MWFLRLLSLHQHLDTRINGKNLDCVIRRGNLFQRVASSVVQNYFNTIPEARLHEFCNGMRLFRFSNAKCNHIGCLNGQICLFMYVLHPVWHVWDNLPQNYGKVAYSIDFLGCSLWALFKCCLSWNDFKQLLASVFMYNIPLRNIFSIFLEASNVISDVVFLVFSLISLRNRHFCTTLDVFQK